jgi:hypothetical protein
MEVLSGACDTHQGAFVTDTNQCGVNDQPLCSVFQTFLPLLFGTIGTAVNLITGFYAMSDDHTVAVRAPGCQHTDSAFKTVERITSSCHLHPERLVVLIAAFVAFCHN